MTIVANALVIDDVESDAFQAVQILRNAGISTRSEICPTARFAIHRLEREEVMPELILIDLSIPHLGGLAFLEWFDRLPAGKTENTRIVLLTGMLKERPFLLRKAMEFRRVIGCIEKPLEAELLMELMEQGLPCAMASNF